jgi:hypothetical protein
MKRDLIRVFQRQGLRPLAIPLVVMFAMVFVFYQYADDYVAHRGEVAELALRLNIMDTTFNLSKNVDVHHSALRPEYTSIQARAYRSEKFDESSNAMKTQLAELLQSLYFDNIEIAKTSQLPEKGVMSIALTAKFSGVPQQLPRLEALLAINPKAMRVSEVRVKVVDDPAGSAPHLDINARFLGVHVEPDVVDKAPSPTARPEAANSQINTNTKK